MSVYTVIRHIVHVHLKVAITIWLIVASPLWNGATYGGEISHADVYMPSVYNIWAGSYVDRGHRWEENIFLQNCISLLAAVRYKTATAQRSPNGWSVARGADLLSASTSSLPAGSCYLLLRVGRTAHDGLRARKGQGVFREAVAPGTPLEVK